VKLKPAMTMLKLILGDESESIWSETQLLAALNSANQRIWRRLVTKNPEQYATMVPSTHSAYPLSYNAGKDWLMLWSYFSGTVIGGATIDNLVPLQIIKLSYSTSVSGLDRPRDIPLVSLSALDDYKVGSTMEYDIQMNYQAGSVKYKAAYMIGDGSLMIRPVPSVTLYLRAYVVAANAKHFLPEEIDLSGGGPYLLHPAHNEDGSMAGTSAGFGAQPYSHMSGLADAVVFDAAYMLGFKDASTRDAFAQERERILETQVVPSAHHEAY
jgi:hypothetical protein